MTSNWDERLEDRIFIVVSANLIPLDHAHISKILIDVFLDSRPTVHERICNSTDLVIHNGNKFLFDALP